MLILPDWVIETPLQPPHKGWGVRVVGDQIADLAPHAVLRERYGTDEIWDAPGEVLAPGFVNAHMHLYGVLAHGIPLDKAPSGFWPFLEDFWWPLVENALDHEMIQAATDLQCARMLHSGVTSFYDCLEAPFALPGCLEAEAEVVRRRGMRASLSFEATERVSAKNGQLGLKENADFIDACRRAGGLVSGMMCFHTTFTCSEAFIRQAFAMARERDSLVHAHVSEGTYEPEHNLRHHGKRTLAYYDHLGLASPDFLASQCVQIDAAEISIMARGGTRMVHMPLSNCEVGGGIAPLPELVAAGVTVGLGTDGYVDDFFEVMRGAFLIHKATHLDPQVMPAHEVWYLATEGGARALGLEKVGRITPGWQADLQLIDAALPTPLTGHNLYDQLLLYRNTSHVRATLVAGRVLVQEGALLDTDVSALRARAHAAAEQLWARARV
ncbi:MAG: amidohydrolase family protein [Anaerolineae bacterium]|nr:amidohydrolase family protein [Anaerolineae bacterium]